MSIFLCPVFLWLSFPSKSKRQTDSALVCFGLLSGSFQLTHLSRLFSEVRGGVRGRVCVWARVGGWVGATDQTRYISHRRPNILIVWCTIWSTVPVISISRAHPGTPQPRLSHLVRVKRLFSKLAHACLFLAFSLFLFFRFSQCICFILYQPLFTLIHALLVLIFFLPTRGPLTPVESTRNLELT